MSERERLVLSDLGKARKPKAHLLRVPLQVEGGLERLTILTNKRIDTLGEDGTVGIFFCSKYTLQPGEVMPPSIMDLHLAEGSTGHIRLVCKDGAVDALTLPASEKGGKHPYESTHTFNYLEYNLEDISEHQFVAIVEKAAQTSSGWVIAEFCSKSRSLIAQPKNLWQLLLSGLQVTLQPQRPMVQEIQLPAVRSSLLSYRLSVHRQDSVGREDLFQPLLRQHISTPYESKFFVNVREANVNLHGVSPYMPPSLRAGKTSDGLSLQFWTDPSAHTEMTVSLRIDVLGSMGKLYMRYRIAFAAFPLLVVALVVRHQFKVYDEAGL